MEWIDEVLQPKMINKNVKWEAITQLMYIKYDLKSIFIEQK